MTVENIAIIVNECISFQKEYEDCYVYADIFRKKYESEPFEEGDRNLLEVLSLISEYEFEPSDKMIPYKPFIAFESCPRVIDNILPEELKQLETIAKLITLSILRARIYDILWLRLRKPDYAHQAIDDFYQCAKKYFNPEKWHNSIQYIERALRLAVLFRRKKNKQENDLEHNLIALLLEWLNDYARENKSMVTSAAIKLLIDFDSSHTEEVFLRTKEIACYLKNTKNYSDSEQYWIFAKEIASKSKKNEEIDNLQKELAEIYVAQAKIQGRPAILSASFMERAITAYKSVPNSSERREQLYHELVEIQGKRLSELQHYETSVDISHIVINAIKSVEGKSFQEAIFILISHISPPNYKDLEKEIIDNKQSNFFDLFSTTYLDNEGKITKQESCSNDSKISTGKLYRNAAIHHKLVVELIREMIDVICFEHLLSFETFKKITINNPFIAPGQEYMWAQGLYAGMKGEYEVALPIIVPLLENSLRYILKQNKVRVSTLNTHGVQEEIRISAILEHEEILKILGYDVVMDLKGLLQERAYANLRNVISHGLGDIRIYYSAPAIYLWCLCLRLVLY